MANKPKFVKTHEQHTESEESREAHSEWSRRAFLRTSAAGAALLMGVGCAPDEEALKAEEERKKKLAEEAKRKAREKVCKAEQIKDNAKEVAFTIDDIKQDDTAFPMGVMAGLMKSSSALLWCFVEDNSPKYLRVWRPSDKKGHIQEVMFKKVTPKEGYFHIPVEGLAPGKRYHYAFLAGDGKSFSSRSRMGSFTTAFAQDCVQPLTIAATACTNVKRFPTFKALQLSAKKDVDLFCHMGDMSYNDGATTKPQYRAKWRKTLQAPGYPELLAHTGFYSTWDDHETVDNSKLYDVPESLRKMGRERYLEAIPQHRDKNDRFWTSFRWGKSVEFFVLDCRGERIPDKKIYISQEQMDWCKKALKESPCHFKVLLNSVPIIQFPEIWKVVIGDRWQGYEAQRNELLDFITNEKLKNVWFLGGDYHLGVVARLEKEGARSNLWEIMAGPGGNIPPKILLSVIESLGDDLELLAPKEQFDLFRVAPSATFITFDPIQDHVRIQFVDPDTEKVVYDKTIQQTS